MNSISYILDDIIKELKRARRKQPNWPDHAAARAGIVCRDSGELMKESLHLKYESGKDMMECEETIKKMRTAAIQCAVSCIRFLENI